MILPAEVSQVVLPEITALMLGSSHMIRPYTTWSIQAVYKLHLVYAWIHNDQPNIHLTFK